MKDQRYVWNPFRMISPKLDSELVRLEELHEIPVSESLGPQEDLLVMTSKLIEITRIFSKCFAGDDTERLRACERLAAEVHQHEKFATTGLIDASSVIGQNVFRIVVRFPSRMERIGIMFGNILKCAEIKSKEGIPFSDKAQAELSQIVALVRDMLCNLRDALLLQNKVLAEHIKLQGNNLITMVEDARFAHWSRIEAGFCAPAASSLYLEILDSIRSINEYIQKMQESLIALSDDAAKSPSGSLSQP